MSKLTKKERVGSEVFEVEYEEKKRTKIENESLVLEMISVSLSNLFGLNLGVPTPEVVEEWAAVITQELKAAGLLV